MLKTFFFLIGFGLSIIGFMYIIAYLNYLEIGYSFKKYMHLIMTSFECILSLIGILIMCITIFIKGD